MMDEERLKQTVTGLLLVVMLVIALDLWLIDLSSMQGVFGALLASELMSFSILCYLYSKPTYSEVGTGWLVAGFGALVAFLMVALSVAGRV